MKIALIITGSLIVILGMLFLMARSRMKNIPAVADSSIIITLTDKNFSHQTKDKLMLVDFWASWCAPCRMMAPVLNSVAEELDGEAWVGKVDVEQYGALAQKYGIRNIPTMILFKNGQEVSRIVGVRNKEYLMQEISKYK